jgi:hypothetical protein
MKEENKAITWFQGRTSVSIFMLVGGLVIASVLSLFAIRWAQKWLVHTVAALLEFVEPEREPQGNGLAILSTLLFSCITLVYVVGAWGAFCVAIPRAMAQHMDAINGWLYLGLGLIWCLLVTPWATRLTMGFGDPNHASAYVHIETKAKYEKADMAFMFALTSSFVIFGLALLAWVAFAIWPNLMQWPYGWFILPILNA